MTKQFMRRSNDPFIRLIYKVEHLRNQFYIQSLISLILFSYIFIRYLNNNNEFGTSHLSNSLMYLFFLIIIGYIFVVWRYLMPLLYKRSFKYLEIADFKLLYYTSFLGFPLMVYSYKSIMRLNQLCDKIFNQSWVLPKYEINNDSLKVIYKPLIIATIFNWVSMTFWVSFYSIIIYMVFLYQIDIYILLVGYWISLFLSSYSLYYYGLIKQIWIDLDNRNHSLFIYQFLYFKPSKLSYISIYPFFINKVKEKLLQVIKENAAPMS